MSLVQFDTACLHPSVLERKFQKSALKQEGKMFQIMLVYWQSIVVSIVIMEFDIAHFHGLNETFWYQIQS